MMSKVGSQENMRHMMASMHRYAQEENASRFTVADFHFSNPEIHFFDHLLQISILSIFQMAQTKVNGSFTINCFNKS